MITMKVQSYDPELGWTFSTQTAMPHAWAVLAGYRHDYPGISYRLVSVSEAGVVTVIPDDADALTLADEARAAG